MNNPTNEAAAAIENVAPTTDVVPTAPVTPIPEKVVVVPVTISALVTAVVDGSETFEVQANKSDGYKFLVTKADTKDNWRKGPSYLSQSTKTGLTFALANYGEKKGLFLKELDPILKAFDGKTVGEIPIKFKNFCEAGQIQIKLPHALGLEKMTQIVKDFITLVDPTRIDINSKVVLPARTPAKVVSPVDTTAPVTPAVPEVPVVPLAEEKPAEVPAETAPVTPVEEPKAEVHPEATPAPTKVGKKVHSKKSAFRKS